MRSVCLDQPNCDEKAFFFQAMGSGMGDTCKEFPFIKKKSISVFTLEARGLDDWVAQLECPSSPGVYLALRKTENCSAQLRISFTRFNMTREMVPPCFFMYATTVTLSLINTMISPMIWCWKHPKLVGPSSSPNPADAHPSQSSTCLYTEEEVEDTSGKKLRCPSLIP